MIRPFFSCQTKSILQASERQLFYGDIANMKQPIRPVYDGEQLYTNKPASYEVCSALFLV